MHTGLVPEGLPTMPINTRCIEARFNSTSKFDRPYFVIWAEFKNGFITRIQGTNKHKQLDVNSDVAKWFRQINFDGSTSQFKATETINIYQMIPLLGKPMTILPVINTKKGTPQPVLDEKQQHIGYYITYRIVESSQQVSQQQTTTQILKCKLCNAVFPTQGDLINHLEKGCNK